MEHPELYYNDDSSSESFEDEEQESMYYDVVLMAREYEDDFIQEMFYFDLVESVNPNGEVAFYVELVRKAIRTDCFVRDIPVYGTSIALVWSAYKSYYRMRKGIYALPKLPMIPYIHLPIEYETIHGIPSMNLPFHFLGSTPHASDVWYFSFMRDIMRLWSMTHIKEDTDVDQDDMYVDLCAMTSSMLHMVFDGINRPPAISNVLYLRQSIVHFCFDGMTFIMPLCNFFRMAYDLRFHQYTRGSYILYTVYLDDFAYYRGKTLAVQLYDKQKWATISRTLMYDIRHNPHMNYLLIEHAVFDCELTQNQFLRAYVYTEMAGKNKEFYIDYDFRDVTEFLKEEEKEDDNNNNN